MRIAVLSDIHDHIALLRTALERVAHADLLICCGDLCSGFIVRELGSGFQRPVHIVFGNNDGDRFRMGQIAIDFPHITIHGEMASLEFAGQAIAVVHYPSLAQPIALSGSFDVVCYGHDHQYHASRQGNTLLLNPGEVMGELTGNASCAIYDTDTRDVTRYDL